MRRWRNNNVEHLQDYQHRWREENAENVEKYERLYRETHAEVRSLYRRMHYATHRKEAREYNLKYRELNKDRVRDQVRRHYAATRERQLAANRRWQRLHRDERREYERKRRAENPAYFKAKANRRQARKRHLPATLSPEDWQYCLSYWEGRCAYCGNQQGSSVAERLCADHFIPLSNPDCPGTVRENIIPACHHCNSSKQTKDAFIWLTETFGKQKATEKLAALQAYFRHIAQKDTHG